MKHTRGTRSRLRILARGLLPALVVGGLVAQEDPILSVTRLDSNSQRWSSDQGLVVRVDVVHPGSVHSGSGKPLRLAPAQGTWAESVTLEVQRDAGPVVLPWARSAPGVAAVTLATFDRLALGFTLEAKPGRDLPPGRYRIRAVMAIAAGGDWQGKAISEPLELTVAAPEEPIAALALSLPVTELAPYEPWVVTIAADDGVDRDVRNMQIEAFDPDGNALPWRFDAAFARVRARAPGPGRQPAWVLAAYEPDRAAPLRAGEYRIQATWRGSGVGSTAKGSLRVRVAAPENGEQRLQTRCALALADALLSRAEIVPAREISQLAVRAAELLVHLEADARAALRSAPGALANVLQFCEVLAQQRRYDEAEAWLARTLDEAPELDAARVTPAEVAVRARLRDLHAEVAARKLHDPTRVAHELSVALVAARQGQDTSPWASRARASSEYGADRWGARQVLGPANVARCGDSPLAWTPKSADGGAEWLEVEFAEPGSATALRIVQNVGPGAIVRVETLDPKGGRALLWQGPDRTVYAAQEIGVLVVPVPPQHPPIQAVRISLDTALVPGWNEIDAVQLVCPRKRSGPFFHSR